MSTTDAHTTKAEVRRGLFVGGEWGGFGQSGNGRELGPGGLAEYRETKHIWQNINPKPTRWFGV